MATYPAASYASRLSQLAVPRRGGAGVSAYDWDLARDIPREPEVEYAMKCAPFANAVAFRATQNAKLPYSSPDPDIDLLLHYPNPHQTRYSFFYAIVQDMLTYGASMVYVEPGMMTDKPRALWPFSPPELREQVRDGDILWEPVRWGTREVIPDADIIKLEQRPGSDLHISSGLEKSWALIVSWAEAMRRVLSVWQHGMTASQYIQVPGVMSDEAKAGARSWLVKNKGRTGPEYGGALILEGGAELKRAELPGAEAYPPIMSTLVSQIAAAMGVPEYVASGKVDVKYSNFEQTLQLAHADVIEPVALQISLELSKKLDAPVSVAANQLLLGGPRQRLDMLNAASFLTTNQRREQAQRWGLFDDDLLDRLDDPVYDRVPKLSEAREELEIERDAARLTQGAAEREAEGQGAPDNIIPMGAKR